MTRTSREKAGVANYTVKRDFRRDFDVEMRREGYYPFWPNRTQPLSGGGLAQNIPAGVPGSLGNLPITQVHMTRLPNGQTAVLAFTATTIYRYYAQENGPYMDATAGDPGVPYMDPNTSHAGVPYFNDNPADWVVVGSGFSTDGHRWEVQECAGYCCINNGVDLPMTYQLTDAEVIPIYELREQGIAAVGTICVYNGILMCADISEIVTSQFNTMMQLISGLEVASGSSTAAQQGALYSGSGTSIGVNSGGTTMAANNTSWNVVGGVAVGFTAGMVGWNIVLANGFESVIQAVTAPAAGVQNVGVLTAMPDANFTGNFWVTNPTPNVGPSWNPDFIATAASAGFNSGLGFTAGMVGKTLLFDSGTSAQILGVISTTQVATSSFLPVSATTFAVVGPHGYSVSGGVVNISQTGSVGSQGATSITANQASNEFSTNNSTWNSGSGFTSGMIGWLLTLENGSGFTPNFQTTIQYVASPPSNSQSLTISPAYSGATEYFGAFWVVNPAALSTPNPDYEVVASDANWNNGSGFTSGMVGRIIQFTNTGDTRVIKDFVNDTTVVVDQYLSEASGPFGVYSTATQSGALYSGILTQATLNVGSNTLTANNTLWNGGIGFTGGMVGQTVVLENGFQATIASVTNDTTVVLSGPAYVAPSNFVLGVFWVVATGNTNYTITASDQLWNGGLGFTASMVGQQLVWSDGESRQITQFISATQVLTDTFIAHATGLFGVTNPAAYGTFDNAALINRYQYRTLWSMPNLPRRFGSIVPASIAAGSNVGTFQFPVMSFAAGQPITFVGAGASGGNLLATIVYIAPGGLNFVLSVDAQTTATLQGVEQSDAEGSIVGFYDLQDDGSGILRMMPLKAALVVYKETSIFLGLYTGQVSSPFQFQQVKIGQNGGGRCLYFRWCLQNVKEEFHLYAGATGFWKFDLINQDPMEHQGMALCADLFFSQASLSDTDSVFSWANDVAQEVWFVVPNSGPDAALVWDWFRDTCSTTGAVITAGETIVKPLAGVSPDPGIKWGMMGMPDGSVTVYGLTNEAPVFDTASQVGNTVTDTAGLFTPDMIYKSVLFANGSMANITAWISSTQVTVDGPAQTVSSQQCAIVAQTFNRNGSGYSSLMQSGLSDLGAVNRVKQARSYVLEQAPDPQLTGLELVPVTVTADFNTALNISAGASASQSGQISLPGINGIPLWLQAYFFQDALSVNGTNNPVRIVRRTWSVTEIDSQSFERMP
jgi:hypothetical protein